MRDRESLKRSGGHSAVGPSGVGPRGVRGCLGVGAGPAGKIGEAASSSTELGGLAGARRAKAFKGHQCPFEIAFQSLGLALGTEDRRGWLAAPHHTAPYPVVGLLGGCFADAASPTTLTRRPGLVGHLLAQTWQRWKGNS